MQTGFSADQEQFRDMVSRFLADKSPPTEVRRWMADARGYDPEVWTQLTQELGLAGTHLPEQFGGHGFGATELGIIVQEMGRHLYCGPFFASAVMAGYAILNSATADQRERLLPPLAAGDKVAALVLDDLSAPERVGRQLTCASGHLSGTAPLVVDAHVADVLIVAAGDVAGVSLYVVDPADAQIRPREVLDPTRKISSVTLKSAPAELLGTAGDAHLDRLWDQMSVALAHEMLGGAERLFETTIEYMKLRMQFGRLIGSFQALKHRAADLLLELELAKAMTHAAARYLDSGTGDAYAPNMAKAMMSEAYMSIARQAIQLRGGIGFTWEEDTHLWFKRAKASEVMLGLPDWHREQMVQRMTEHTDAPASPVSV